MNIHDVSVQRLVRESDAGPKSFGDLVTEDVKGTISDADHDMLRQPEHWDAFYGELTDMLRSFENQLTRQKARSLQARQDALSAGTMAQWEAEHLKVLEWRRTMNNLRRHVEARIREIRALRRSFVKGDTIPEVLSAAELLVQAVTTHRDVAANDVSDDDIQAADQRLWETLDDPAVGTLIKRLQQFHGTRRAS